MTVSFWVVAAAVIAAAAFVIGFVTAAFKDRDDTNKKETIYRHK